ncbi:MAG: ATP-dependent DNA helicase RecG [Firmicutes bacterium]|nr:ATP-dependent DNA helicase RecG [Bacillota bacterium]
MKISDPVSTVSGVGPKKEQVLKEAGIETLGDLLAYFPRSYEDRRNVRPIADLKPGETALIEATVLSRRYSGNPYKKNTPLSLLITDGSANAEVVYFNGHYLAKLFAVNETYVFYGRMTENFARRQFVHPEFTRAGSKDDVREILPVYPDLPGLSQKEMRRLQHEIAALADEMPEWLPADLVHEQRLCSPAYAVRNLHFPVDGRKVLEAKYRLVFEELFTLETGLMLVRGSSRSTRRAVSFPCAAGDRFAASLPFSLTAGQQEAWQAIKADLESPKRMNRLLQGDVGSGKTVLAQMAMLAAADAGYQSVIMAPTELLARQHYESFQRDLSGKGLTIELLISSIPKKEKDRILRSVEDGSCTMLIATHAVLEENVVFANLGLVITDEQHRFGVSQRRRLSAKAEDANILVMTATPIPRTLAVILFGDLDVSQIRTMPAGRQPVKTTLVRREERGKMYRFVASQLREGRQAYVVAPLISESEKIEALSAEELYEELVRKLKDFRVALVHGAMKAEEKSQVMEDFAAGRIQVLVSTVVIEVGINVANASVMVIENAERFGLAQLHQLRGRVGRGTAESYCFLVTDSSSEIAVKRAEIMCQTTSGFEIAEEDLKLRGPGEVFGTRQHGLPELSLADLARHQDVLERAAQAAKKTVQEDPDLQAPTHQEVRKRVERMFRGNISLDL